MGSGRAIALVRAGATAYAASTATGARYKRVLRAAKRAGLPTTHDHCTACGGRDHRAIRGRCSPSYLAARDHLDRGLTLTEAARKHGLRTASAVAGAVARLR